MIISKRCSNTEKPAIVADLPNIGNFANTSAQQNHAAGSKDIVGYTMRAFAMRLVHDCLACNHLLFLFDNTKTEMNRPHKNKTFATLLAALLGGFGAHRFYLYGGKDRWAWVHVILFPFSIYAGFIEALVIGLTSDEKWDVQHNADSGRKSESAWPLAVLLVLTMGLGTVAVIATLARTFDLLYTGGAYG